MRASKWTRLLLATVASALLSIPVNADQPVNAQRGWQREGRRFRQDDRTGLRRTPRVSQEPAFARGYADGYDKGLADSRGRERYDPVRHKDYKEADQGYVGTYGTKDAYRNNYRAGFRQGYDDGYRDSTK